VRWQLGGIHEGAPEVTVDRQHIESQIEGLRLVYLTGAKLDRSEDRDDTGHPYRLEVNLGPPELMEVAFIMLYGGSEEIIVRATARDAINQFIELNAFTKHPRFRRMTITGPDGLHEEISR
jgi:hypothetical protein